MTSRRQRRVLDLLGIEVPIVQAPMLGVVTPCMIVAVARAGGLGSLSLAALSPEESREMFAAIRRRTLKPINVNFLCHGPVTNDRLRQSARLSHLNPHYAELDVDIPPEFQPMPIEPFNEVHCGLVEELKPEVVSFHFGLPSPDLVERVRRTGAKILSSATTVEEAKILEAEGCDAIIAQGIEAGGHRATFLEADITAQVGTMALVPQVVDAVKVPVIAAGGIGDPRGVAAAFALGASAVQVGTAFLFCPEANISPLYRRALGARDHQTVITDVLSGRPARVIANRAVRKCGPFENDAPAFPLHATAFAPLCMAQKCGALDFTPLWCGQAAHLGRSLSAAKLIEWLSSGCDSKSHDSHLDLPIRPHLEPLIAGDDTAILHGPSRSVGQWPPSVSPHSDKLFRRVCLVADSHFTDPDYGSSDIAAELGISLRYLQKLFTTRGSTCSRYLHSLRLDWAFTLLKHRAELGSDQSISEIAWASGFRDINHFYRLFRQRFGHTPGATLGRRHAQDHHFSSDDCETSHTSL